MTIALIAVSFPLVAAADPVRIVAFGDSLTQGYGLPRGQGFVPQLQGWLDQAGVEAQVINAGVSGDTTAGGLARISWTLADTPDAMIVALGANDVLRGLDPARARANIDGILQAATSADVEVLLVGIASVTNYGPEYQAAFDALYADLAAKYGVALFPNFIAGALEVAEAQGGFDGLLQSDGLHPNAQGVALIVEAMGPDVAALAARAAE